MTLSANDVDRLFDDRLNPARTLLLVALGCFGLTEFVLLTTMLLTEPKPLPTDTVIALSLVAFGGLVWAMFAAWRLARRHVMMLTDRLAASALATLFSVVAVAGGVSIAVTRDRPSVGLAILATGTIGIGAAAGLLHHQIGRYRTAQDRLVTLEPR